MLQSQEIAVKIKNAQSVLFKNPEKARQIVLGLKDMKMDESDKLKVLFLLTNTSNLTGRFTDAIKYGNDALVLAQHKKDDITQIKIYGILGNLYQAIPLNEKTKNYLNRAEEIIKQTRIPDSLRYIEGNIYYLKGMNYANTLDCEMGIRYFDKAIEIYESARNPLSDVNLKLAYLNKGFCYIEMKNIEVANKTLNLAQIEENNIEVIRFYPSEFIKSQNLYTSFGNAKILSLKKDYGNSNNILQKILEEGSPTNLSIILSDVYKQLSDNYLQIGDIIKSQKYDDLYQKELKKNDIKHQNLLNVLIEAEQKNYKQASNDIFKKYIFFSILVVFFSVILLGILLLKIVNLHRSRKRTRKEIN